MPPVLFTDLPRLDLGEVGILVPLMASRPDRVREALTARFGPPESGWGEGFTEGILGRADLLRVHTPAYVDLLLSRDPAAAVLDAYELLDEDGRPHRYAPHAARRPMADLVARAVLEASGTALACERALAEGFCQFLGGGMHHAFAERGRGFCLIHDVLVAVRRLQARGQIHDAWIVDTDCHKGDGTAVLTQGDDSVLTFSIHMARGWPLDGPPVDGAGHLDPAFWPSTVDRGVPEGGEGAYLELLASGLRELEIRAGGRRPSLAVVVAGSDPSELDVLPSARGIRLPLSTMLERDLLVHDHLASRGIPQAWVMAGGYGEEVWQVHAAFLEALLSRPARG